MEKFMCKVRSNVRAAILFIAAGVSLVALSAATVWAQETGGDLGGGAGIFRAKNPETKRGSNPSRPGPRPVQTLKVDSKTRSAPATMRATRTSMFKPNNPTEPQSN